MRLHLARWTVRTLLLAVGSLASLGDATSGEESKRSARPNFVVVLSDDLGYGDLGCYGHPIIKTPHIDRFAAEGLRFTDCYAAAANCSPARTGLLTGRTPYRVGIHNWIPMESPMHVRRSEITVATLLKRAGYTTCHVGKWHLNGKFNSPEQPQPSDHGFDHWFSTQNNAMPWHRNPDNFVRNGKPVGRIEGYAADIVANEAIRWLKEMRDPQKPFFLYVCFHEPHEPIATAPRFERMYASIDKASQRAHHGNITQMDYAFGRLLRTIDALGLRDTTFVFFTSDNGPAITDWHPHGSAGPLRDKKGYLYEGGIRVPGIIRWPHRTKAGQVCDEPISGVDLLPTLCAIAGVDVPDDRPIDGANIRAVFAGKPVRRETPLYWQYNYSRGEPKVAMRVGDHKILATLTGPKLGPISGITAENMHAIKTAELDRFELYDLREDIGETEDLAKAKPQRVRRLSTKLRQLYREVQEESPVWPAWECPHIEGKRIREHRKSLRKRD